jgi:hypothetical protein
LGEGIWSAVRVPSLLLAVCILTVAAALPFGLVLGTRVQTSLAHQPPIDLGAEEIDAEWWMEFRAHAQGLEATFTPTIIGFAAPLDNLSTLLDASPRPWALAGPIALYVLLWAFLWGGVIDRFQQRRGTLRTFFSAGMRCFPRLIMLSLGGGAMVLLLYLTVHAALFGPVYESLVRATSSERNAFFLRVSLYISFGALLAAVSLLTDYARIGVVGGQASTLADAVVSAARFIRRHWTTVVSLYLLTGTLFVGLLVAYGLIDRRAGGWRGVIVGQAYIVGRLAVRLVWVASEVRLVERVGTGQPQDVS